MNRKKFFSIAYFGLICILLCCSCSKRVSLESLLGEMVDREQLTRFPDRPYSHKQFSSYNRASVSPDEDGWFANMDMSHFIRVEENDGRREFVMFDASGPGSIVRWWMTFYKAQNGTIRIYIDHDTIPVIAGPPDQLLSGELLTGYPLSASLQEGAPRGEEGRDYDHNLYVPIPYSSHCKITYECDSLRLLYDYEGTPVPQGYWWPDVFYNIGYRLYSEDVEVESFTLKAHQNAEAKMNETGKILLVNNVNSSESVNFEKKLLPGDSLSIEIDRKMTALNRLSMELDASQINQALRSTVLKISFDGNQTVWVPVGEFFGTGYSVAIHQTWMNQRDEQGIMESFWVMPFKEKCQLTFINYGNEEVFIKGFAGVEPYKWSAESMYFGASWHEYYRINSRDENNSPFDLNMVNIEGKGVYVGDQITLFNNTYHWWGEGDEKIFVDGEAFPSSFGTGTEDYYGYSFARQEPFSHPFLSQPVGIGNMARGVAINMRHRSLDAIPFHSSISSNMELWHWASIQMNYAITSYYYVMLPYKVNIVPDIKSVQNPVALTRSDFNPLEN